MNPLIVLIHINVIFPVFVINLLRLCHKQRPFLLQRFYSSRIQILSRLPLMYWHDSYDFHDFSSFIITIILKKLVILPFNAIVMTPSGCHHCNLVSWSMYWFIPVMMLSDVYWYTPVMMLSDVYWFIPVMMLSDVYWYHSCHNVKWCVLIHSSHDVRWCVLISFLSWC